MGLGMKIRALREHLGWSQAHLGDQAGVTQATLSALEKRDSSRSVYFVPLARALGVTLEDLRDLTIDELKAQLAMGSRTTLQVETTEPIELYRTPGERQARLLRLFDELHPTQQAQILRELETTVEANRAIALHYRGRQVSTTENERVEATYGRPPAKK